MTFLIRLLPAVLALCLPGALCAQALPLPQGEVILTLRGTLAHANVNGTAQFDLAMLDALEQRETTTATPWHEGVQQFSGPRIASILEAAGADGSELRIIAINDYAANMPWQDVQDHPVILASRRNGETLSVRETGPLFVIYPFDEEPELHDEVYFSRSVWQVQAIEVLP
mgnify:CR=1 FL=1